MINFKAFVDELEKIAVQLNSDEQRNRQLAYTGLGMLSGPVIGGVGNFIQTGKFGPATGVSLKRWIPATMATGALISGALPIARSMIDDRIKANAKLRLAKESA